MILDQSQHVNHLSQSMGQKTASKKLQSKNGALSQRSPSAGKHEKLDVSKRVLPTIKDGHVYFTTMRQELLTKLTCPGKESKAKKDVATCTECVWSEPFVLYYDEECDSDSNSESQLKFTIQMGFDDLVQRKRQTVVVEQLVGEFESFHLDQFSEGQIYLKEIRFGSKQSKNDILGFEADNEDKLGFGGTLLCKI